MADTASEPRQPRRLEKNRNISVNSFLIAITLVQGARAAHFCLPRRGVVTGGMVRTRSAPPTSFQYSTKMRSSTSVTPRRRPGGCDGVVFGLGAHNSGEDHRPE
jgi:hypothetical protein